MATSPKPKSKLFGFSDEELRAKSEELRERSEKVRVSSETLRIKSERQLARSDTVLAVSNILFSESGDNIIKRCSCGAIYTPSNWFQLVLLGYQYNVPGIKGEMRNCSACNSTLFFVSHRGP